MQKKRNLAIEELIKRDPTFKPPPGELRLDHELIYFSLLGSRADAAPGPAFSCRQASDGLVME
jgi:hypothetical protein